ncbi:maturation protein [ssRNA phage SRR6960799_39]|uniref:Maturation protein n=1 Tax=ssRNA phage SRR6960799_39 TaxID=2786597 RepID=A0A8S5L0N7_9VIRU|nr:maturation protein [ssRNA phage SRR6960799_39]DAD50690.1 TPA_asm: maturation protein [ssRNA phage SRR6960799_39]
MTTRTRTKNLRMGAAGTSRYRVGTGSWLTGASSSAYYRHHEYCQDNIGLYPWRENNLILYTKDAKPLVYDGTFNDGSITHECNALDITSTYCSANLGAVTSTTDGHVPGSISTTGYLQTELLNRVKPDNPEIDLLNFLWELQEFPAMLKDAGDLWKATKAVPDFYRYGVKLVGEAVANRRKDLIAGAPITVAFGWRPLLSDLRKLVGVAEAVDARIKRLNDASKRGGTETRLVLRKGKLAYSHKHSYGLYSCKVNRTTEFKEWGVLKHSIPTGRVPNWTFNEAVKLVYSTELSASTIWESLPWSWLADYLFNVGNFLKVTSNRIGWKATQALIMGTYVTTHEFIPLSPFPAGTKNGSMTRVSKNRTVLTNPTPVVAFTPMLTAGQLQNLGALALALGFKSKSRVAW